MTGRELKEALDRYTRERDWKERGWAERETPATRLEHYLTRKQDA